MNKNVSICILLIVLFVTGACVISAKENSEVKSTEGIEVQKEMKVISDTTTKSDKLKLKKEKKYTSNVEKIKKLREKKRLKQRDLDYLQNRYELSKNKLEEVSSDSSEKGEEK